ncbi:response regulator [Hoeflea sp. WL0058]|uniref:histidine kinase n=1 Tax=Flavimaribacter sediminis TaxID=2865987 RepID=A0AAE3D2U8_9HYPH|nr:PAS domain-containing hybrid sensor histidine kinase/response regulator [Flavimaribacter sediminis]MBW8638918.1 response regulator [Flavimaribacter sediminis]
MSKKAAKGLVKQSFLKRQLRPLLLLLILAMCVTTLSVLGSRMAREITSLQSAPLDNIQWNLAQLEIEYLSLLNSINTAQDRAGPDASVLSELRKRFDIFYSRIDTLQTGRPFRQIENDDTAKRLLIKVRSSLIEELPVIDGDDADLYGSLAGLEEDFLLLRPDVRSLSLRAVKIFAESSDRQRANFSLLLQQTAVVGVLLVLALLVAVTVLVRQFQVAERRALEASRSSSRFVSTVNASLDAIILADAKGTVIDFSPAAETIFGYTRNRSLGSNMAELIIPPNLRDAHAAGMRRFLETGEKKIIDAGRVEVTAMRSNGATFPVELSIGMTMEPEGPIFIAYVRDISERKRNQQELMSARDEALAADKAKSQFLAMMSHEMRTPLNGVLATLDLLQSSALDGRQEDYVRTAIASGEILQQHLDDVLDITSIEAGAMEFRYNYFSLDDLLEEVRSLNERTAAEQNDVIVLDIADDLSNIYSDRHRLRQILLNLVGNAVKFTQGGTITVTARSISSTYHNRIVELTVSDTGIGIKQEDIERIFDEFVTLDSSYRRKTQGYGLGLAICRRISEGLGGHIGIESTPGAGSTFTVTIPIAATSQMGAESDAETAENKDVDNLKVLLVEDNETNRFVAVELLQAEGCDVDVAINGIEGVEKSQNGDFDLILMDISMPLMDGIEATHVIRKGGGKSATTPIIGLTAHALPHELESLTQAGMQDCLIKPLRKRNLQKMLRSFRQSRESEAVSETPRTAVIDRSVMDELAELLPAEKLKQRMDDFLNELSESEELLQAHFEHGRLPELAALAHRCAGSAATFGATELANAMRGVQTAAQEDRIAELGDAMRGVGAIAGRTRKALERYKSGACDTKSG